MARFLSSFLGRTVVDGTGLTGRYDISLLVPNPEQNVPDAQTTALFQALEDQLGLKLVSRKEMVDTIVIDHLERPSEN
ncbi:MAG TPA: TIGR03435 family protein [Terracidiphilus sp.]